HRLHVVRLDFSLPDVLRAEILGRLGSLGRPASAASNR
ncbi:MAG: hypothetical protein RI988_2754, partial [Pseudomonadota bacterium]